MKFSRYETVFMFYKVYTHKHAIWDYRFCIKYLTVLGEHIHVLLHKFLCLTSNDFY